jgi:hypothetical protein
MTLTGEGLYRDGDQADVWAGKSLESRLRQINNAALSDQ